MRVQVKYFSVLHTVTGRRDEIVELPENSNGTALLDLIINRYPQVEQYREYLRLAVNLEYCDFTKRLSEMDEVVLIPPVSGG